MKKLFIGLMASVSALCALAQGWEWNPSTNRLTEQDAAGTPWIFSGGAIDSEAKTFYINGTSQQGDSETVDFGTGVYGEWTFVQIGTGGNGPFKQKSWTTTVILPNSLRRVHNWAFENYHGEIFIPEENDITTLEDAAFTGSYLSGRVNLPNITALKGGDGQGPFNSCSKLKELELGPGVTSSGHYGALCKNSGSVTNLITHCEGSFTITAWTLQYCNGLRNWTFNAVPTLESNWASGISFSGKDHRIRINKKESSWIAKMHEGTFTPWASADQTTYHDKFGFDAEEPLGWTTSPFNAWLLAIPEAVSEGAVMHVEAPSVETKYGQPNPDYGDYQDITETMTYTCPRYYHDGVNLRECVGYDLYKWVGDTWAEKQSVNSLSFEYTPDGNEERRLVWRWADVGFHVTLGAELPAGCSVTTNVAYNLEGYYSAGTVVSFTAVGENFKGWTKAPAGVDKTLRTISFAVNEPITIVPYFENNWHFDSSNNTISDGYWTFGVNVNEERLTIKSHVRLSDVALLNFDKPVDNGKVITGFNLWEPRFFTYVHIDDVYLPKTLETIAGWEFQNSKNYDTTIHIPEDNNLISIGEGTFESAKVFGKLVLDKLSHSLKQRVFSSSTVKDVVLGPDVTGLAINAFSFVPATNFVFKAKSFKFDAWSFELNQGQANLSVEFRCFPDMTTGSWNGNMMSGSNVRFLAPCSEAGWQDIINGPNFTRWTACGNKSDYYAKFGANAKKPIGYMTSPHKCWLVDRSTTSTMLFMK